MFKIMKRYIQSRKLFLILILSLFILYPVSIYLENGHLMIGYSLFLCVCVTFLFLMLDFIKFHHHHKELIELSKNINLYEMTFKETHDLIFEDYQSIIQLLNDNIKMIKTYHKTKETELSDYYTLWVHQIKTPIAAMKLLIETNQIQPEHLKIELFKIEQYASMALEYLRIETMHKDLKLGAYDLRKIVQGSIRKYSILFIYQHLKLQLDEFDFKVYTDEKWLSFIIEQILSNAIKYTPQGSIHIYLKNQTLYIQDTGIGIKDEDLKLVFERGFTGLNGRHDKISSGLGLYLCQKVSGELGHTITMSSKVNQGTCVMITFNGAKVVFD